MTAAAAPFIAEASAGWTVEPTTATRRTSTSRASRRHEFKELPDGAKEARYHVHAVVSSDGRDYSDGYSLVTRPDIGGFFYYQPALQRASVVEVKIPPRAEDRLHHGRGRRHSRRAAGSSG